MFARSFTLFTLVSAIASVAVAAPPACVIGAVSTSKNPRDIKSVCDNADGVKSYLAKNCGANQQVAIGYFSSVCGDAGVTISTQLPSSSGSSSATSVSSSAVTSVSSSAITSSTGASSASSASGANVSVSSSTDSSNPSASSGSSRTSGSLTTSVVVATPTNSVPAASASASPRQTGLATRVGMDVVGMAAVGALGAMLAM